MAERASELHEKGRLRLEKEFLKSRLETEQERCLARLAELTPGSEEYDRCWTAVCGITNVIRYELTDYTEPAGVPAPPVHTPAPIEPVVITPSPAEATTLDTPTEPPMKKEDVRAALADARMKGVDVSKLIADMGAANLTGVDPADYPKLMDALAKELEGK